MLASFSTDKHMKLLCFKFYPGFLLLVFISIKNRFFASKTDSFTCFSDSFSSVLYSLP